MIIKAKYNKQENIPSDIRQYAFEGDEKGVLPLTTGKDYVVADVWRALGHEFYLIVSDAGQATYAPWWYPKELFEIVDASMPDDWQRGGDSSDNVYTFPELAESYADGGKFQSQLEDGGEPALGIFKSYYDLYTQSNK